jgi:hypothetical protein
LSENYARTQDFKVYCFLIPREFPNIFVDYFGDFAFNRALSNATIARPALAKRAQNLFSFLGVFLSAKQRAHSLDHPRSGYGRGVVGRNRRPRRQMAGASKAAIFKNHGVEAQIILLRGGTTVVASLVAGDVYLAFTTGVSALGAASQGTGIKMLTHKG